MSIECSECERDLRGGHDLQCSRYVDPRDEVCEAALEYLDALGDPKLDGGKVLDRLQNLRDAVFGWQHPEGI